VALFPDPLFTLRYFEAKVLSVEVSQSCPIKVMVSLDCFQ
jgi:hypothetical protein